MSVTTTPEYKNATSIKASAFTHQRTINRISIHSSKVVWA
jgi:hypothetical protein